MRVSIHFVVIPLMVALAIVSCATIGSLIYNAGAMSVGRSSDRLRKEIVLRVQTDLGAIFRAPLAILQNLQAASRIEGTFDFRNPDTWDAWLCSALRINSMRPTYIGTEDGRWGVATLEADTGLCFLRKVFTVGWLQPTRMNFSALGSPYYVEPVRGAEQVWNFDPRQRPWYNISRDGTAWSEIYLNFNSVVTAVTVGTPMIDPALGRNVGVIATDFRTEQLLAYFRTIDVAKTGVMVLAESSTRNVVGATWDEPVVFNITRNDGGAHGNETWFEFQMARLEDFNERLLRGAVANLGSDELFECNDVREGSDVRCARTYGKGRNRVFVDVVGIQDENGLNLRLIVLIPESDFLADIWKRADVAIGAAIGVVAALIIFSIVVVYFVLKPLRHVEERLYRTATLADEGSEDDAPSVFAEVANIQIALAKMAAELRELKAFVPQNIFAVRLQSCASCLGSLPELASGASKRAASGSSNTNPLEFTSLGNGGEVEASPAHGHWTVSRSSSENSLKLALAEGVLDARLNSFAIRRCTAVRIDHSSLPTGDSDALACAVGRQLDAVVSAAIRAGGVIESMSPAAVLVTFNAHHGVVSHEERAVGFAVKAAAKVARGTVIAVDTSSAAVGTCGSGGRRARVVLGECVDVVEKLPSLVRSCFKKECRVVVTERCGRGVLQRQLAIVDSVSPRWEQPERAPVIHICVVAGVAHASQAIFTETHRAAYSLLLRGHAVEAAAAWHTIPGHDDDHHVQRLLRTCDDLCRSSITPSMPGTDEVTDADVAPCALHQGYIRLEQPMWESLGCREGARVLDATRTGSTSTPPGTSFVGLNPEAVMQQISSAFAVPSIGQPDDSQSLFPIIGEEGVLDQAPGEADVAQNGRKTITDVRGVRWTCAEKALERGSFGEVFHALCDTGALAVVKVLSASARNFDVAAIQSEVQVLAKLKHENIVPYVSVALAESNAIFIIMELVPGGSLRDLQIRFGALPPPIVRRYLVDILHGLAYLHSHGVTHCDVKPGNVLLSTDGVCKLADFGSALNATDAFVGSYDSMRGTAWYVAPEVAYGERPTPASDMWSLGVMLLELLVGAVPWTVEQRCGNNEAKFLRNIARMYKTATKMGSEVEQQAEVRTEEGAHVPPLPPIPPNLSPTLSSLIRRCLVISPGQRATCADLVAEELAL